MADEHEIPPLSRLRPPRGAVQKKLRVGRGPGSGVGKTAGRGQKGQKARQPGRIHKIGFEGGQMPLVRRLPKFGFHNLFALKVVEVNVGDLAARFEAGSVVDSDGVKAKRLVRGRFDVLKVLGNGEIDRALTVRAHRFSASAKEKIEKAGGKVEIIATRPVDGEAASE
jgi:large subunit ribosomal protein L15